MGTKVEILKPTSSVSTERPTWKSKLGSSKMEQEDDTSVECNLLDYRARPDMDNKRRVIVHVTFLKIGEINTLKEVFEADVLLRTKWRLPELDIVNGRKIPDGDLDLSKYWNPEIYIDNVVGEPKRTASIHMEHDANGHAYVIERRRVRGSFLETMELWEFPFDIQDLSVTVMSEKAINDVELEEDPDEVHKIYKQSFIDEQEWYLYKYIGSEKKEMMKDKADPTILRSALTIRCKSARRPAFFLWNSFSVTFLICCLSFVTFAVKPELPQNRLQLSFTLVLTAVAFKFVVNQSLPRISYLTYLDRYILATMLLLVSTCIWHGTQTLISHAKYPDADRIALVIIAGSYIAYNIQFLVRIYFLDRYIMATMICLVVICAWHGTITIVISIVHDSHTVRVVDLIALCTLAAIYVLYNVIFVTRLTFEPYKKRRYMKKLEKDYIALVKKEVEIRQSTKRGDNHGRTLSSVIAVK